MGTTIDLWPVGAEVGEGPFWDTETRTVFWIDVRKLALHQQSSDGAVIATWPLPEPVGTFAILADGKRALVALASGLAVLNLASGMLETLIDPEPDQPANRLNEGKVSPCGRHFVFGSTHDSDPQQATGSLYCFSADRSLRTLAGGLTVANGVAWSPDGQRLYFSDSRTSHIWVCDWHPDTGTINNSRLFAAPTEQQGRPDGAAMDVSGEYWSAGVSAGRLNRYAPDGRLVEIIPLPVQAPTMPAFGPAGSGTLYVTSHRRFAKPTADDDAIVVLRVAIDGIPQRRLHMA